MLNILKTVAHSFTVMILFSCSSNERHDLKLVNALNEGLIKSTQTIEQQNHILYQAIEQRTTERQSSDKAKTWFPKAQSIRELSNDLNLYIESLKNDLINEAGIDLNKKEDFDKLNDKRAVQNIFNSKNKNKELFEKIEKCKNDLLKIDSSIDEIFKNTIVFSDKVVKTLSLNDFSKTNMIEAFAILSELQNKVKINENQMLSYCLSKSTPYIGCGFGRGPKLLITQSSSYVKAGEKININVGIGNFDVDVNPIILINNKQIPIETDGTSNSVITASGSMGKHFVPIKVTYLDADGNETTKETEIEYEVAPKPK